MTHLEYEDDSDCSDCAYERGRPISDQRPSPYYGFLRDLNPWDVGWMHGMIGFPPRRMHPEYLSGYRIGRLALQVDRR